MTKRFFLIDAYTIIFRSYYAFIKNPRINSKGFNTSVIFGFANTLLDIVNTEHPDYIIAALDGDKPSFRAEIYPEYKANRPSAPEDIKKSIPYVKQLLEAFNVEFLQIEPYEADDIIGSLAKKYKSPETDVYMVTTDKDYVQLLEDHIYMFRPRTRSAGYEKVDANSAVKKYGLKYPLQFIDYLALVGDSSDNIPGAKGIGEKSAIKLLQEFETVENIYANIDKVDKRYRQKLIDSKDDVFLSKKLATIVTDIDLNFDLEKFRAKKYDKDKLVALFKEMEFRTLLNKISPQNVSMGLFGENEIQSSDGSKNEAENSLKTIDDVPHRYSLITTTDHLDELLEKLKTAKEFAFDTEASSTDPITATPIGVSFSTQEHEGYYLPLNRNVGLVKYFTDNFKEIFADLSKVKIAHNLKYDKHILSHIGIEVKQPYFDTIVAHYLIDPDLRHNMDYLSEIYLNYKPVSLESLIGKKGKKQKPVESVPVHIIKDYAAEDADVTFQLKQVLAKELEEKGLTNLFEAIEIPLIDVLVHMEENGVKIDVETLKNISTQIKTIIFDIESKIYELAGEEFNISSTQQLGKILFEKLKITDKPKLTKTKQYSTSEETLSKLKDKHPIVKYILEYRTLTKLLNTYVDALPQLINPATGKIHTNYNQTVANTGRLSSTNPNLQNIPVRDDIGKMIRKAFVPENEDNFFVSADYSQIELRIMAHFSGDEHMIRAFVNDEDIHAATAAKIYKVPVSKVTHDMRKKAKVANFGIIYGISAFGLAERLEISRKEAKQLIDGYFESFPDVKKYMERVIAEAREKGYVETLFGRKKYLPDINSRNHIVRGYAERNAINMPIQGTAADIIKKAMISIYEEMKSQRLKTKMILQVHDELCFDVPSYELGFVKDLIREKMESAAKLAVPLKVDIGVGSNWLEAH